MDRDALNPPANLARSLRQQHTNNTNNTRDSTLSPHQHAGARDRDRSRSPQVTHPRLPRRQDSTSATASGEGGSSELPAHSASLSTEGDSGRPQANPEDIMSIIAQLNPTQKAQMREQMLKEQMLEQLHQPSPPHPPQQQQQQPPTIHDNQQDPSAAPDVATHNSFALLASTHPLDPDVEDPQASSSSPATAGEAQGGEGGAMEEGEVAGHL